VLFTTNPGRAFSRDFLLERIWDDDYEGFDRAVDTHIRRLRRKLGPLGDAIVTVWGVGYRFVPEGRS
jgi:DNA-binding response OmpR family regulator